MASKAVEKEFEDMLDQYEADLGDALAEHFGISAHPGSSKGKVDVQICTSTKPSEIIEDSEKPIAKT